MTGVALPLAALTLLACVPTNALPDARPAGTGSPDAPGGPPAGDGIERGNSPTADATDGEDAPAGNDGGGGNEDAPVPPPPPFDWMGVVGTGQSLAVGNLGVPVNATPTAFHNMKLSGITGPPFDPDSASLTLVPLVEPIRPLVPLSGFPSAYPANIFGETPHRVMADQISTLYARAGKGEYRTVHSIIGESGQAIAVIGKGAQDTGRTGRAYAVTLFEVRAIKRLAAAAGASYGVGAIVMTHGEQDATSTSYEDAVRQLWTDYNNDIKAITGQTTPIPMLMTQQHSAPFAAGSAALSTVATWRLGVKYPGEMICVGPKYHYQYESEGRHLGTHQYDRMGAKYGQVYYERVVLGRNWQPLQPKSATRQGRTITVDFNVPVPPLNWDENIPPPHQTALTEWAKGRGFEVNNAGGRVAIDAVAIQGSSVVVTLAADSAVTDGWTVGYALAQDAAGAMAGPTRGRRGQLRDSDPMVGIDAAVVSCSVISGSAQIQPRTANGFRDHGARDLAEGAGLAAETIVVTASDSAMTLSKPWTGPSGTADIRFRSDHRNYGVAFEMPVR